MIPLIEQIQNNQESVCSNIQFCQQQFIPEHLQQLLAQIYLFANKNHSVTALVSLGSFARKELTTRSDLDLCLVIENGKYSEIVVDLKNFFHDTLLYALVFPQKVVLYFKIADKHSQTQLAKIDLFIVNTMNDILKYLEELSHTIKDPVNIVLLDKDKDKQTTLDLHKIFKTFNESISLIEEKILYNIHSCINAFENASYAHAVKDSYRYYFNITITYHYILVLRYILAGNMDALYLPRNIYPILFKNTSRTDIEQLEPKSDLETAQAYKEKLMNLLLLTIEQLQRKYALDFNLSAIHELLENIFRRDLS